MFREMFEEKNLQFDLSQSIILVKLTPVGNEIIKLLDPNGRFPQNEEGYYEIFTSQLFTLYRSLLMRNTDAQITDLVEGPILVPSIYLKAKGGYVNKIVIDKN